MPARLSLIAVAACAAAALAAPAAAVAAAGEQPVRGRNYIYAVERAEVVATLDGVQHADDADLRVHAAMRYRVGTRHADGFAYAYWADEHGPGIAPYGEIMPPRSGWRWRGRVTGELRLEPAQDGTPRTRSVDCALPPQVERDLVVSARAREGRPWVAELPVPWEIDDCGMRSPPGFFGDSGFARVRLAAPPALLRRRHVAIPIAASRTVRGDGGSWTIRWRGSFRLRRVYACAPPTRIGTMRRIGCIDSFLRHRV